MYANIDQATYDQLWTILTDRNIIPSIDFASASDGYQNIVIGICPPGAWGYNLVLRVAE